MQIPDIRLSNSYVPYLSFITNAKLVSNFHSARKFLTSQLPWHIHSFRRQKHLRTGTHYCELSKGVPSRSVAVSQPIPFPHWQYIPRFAAVAAGPSRRNPPGRHLWYGFLIRFLSTLAAFPAICCRCGKRSYLIVPNCRDSRPDLPNSVRIYTLCRYILSFCIVQHAA